MKMGKGMSGDDVQKIIEMLESNLRTVKNEIQTQDSKLVHDRALLKHEEERLERMLTKRRSVALLLESIKEGGKEDGEGGGDIAEV